NKNSVLGIRQSVDATFEPTYNVPLGRQSLWDNSREIWRLPCSFVFSVSIRRVPHKKKPLKKINWGVTSLSAGNWIPWIAKEAKIYEKNALDVELILLRGSGQTSAAIPGGSLFAAPVVFPTVMLADLSGADLVNVAHTVPGVQSKLVAKSDIKRPDDLKGKRIASSSLGLAWGFSLQIY